MSSAIESVLRPHQRAPYAHLVSVLRRYPAAVDASEPGIGKTFVACAVATQLQLPTLVVCPKIVITDWHNAAAAFGEKISVINYEKLATGNTPFGQWAHPRPVLQERTETFRCECCQQTIVPGPACAPCYTNPAGLHCVGAPRRRPHVYGKFTFHPAVGLVIFDEIHRCSGLASLNSEMLIGAVRGRIRTLGLSATLGSSPLAFRALGYALGLHTLTPSSALPGQYGFYDWAARYGCRRDPNFHGFKWFASEAKQRETMQAIHASIFPQRGVRVRCDEVPGFPAINIQAKLYDIEEPDKLAQIYAEMDEAIKLLDQSSNNDKDPQHPLTKILRARQRAELFTVPIAVELAEDALATGRSVAIFADFRGTLDALSERLKTRAIIDGSPEGVRDRGNHIAEFQADKSRVILANSRAGGASVSLQDLRGEYPRLGLVFPTWSATVMRQTFGRTRRDGGKSTAHYIVMCIAGVQEKVWKAVNKKANNLDALNNGDLIP